MYLVLTDASLTIAQFTRKQGC